MFLDLLRRRNPAFLEAAISLHQSGALPPNTYVVDLDTVQANARLIKAEADKFGLEVFAMTKQLGRNPDVCRTLQRAGLDTVVAVDMPDARATTRAGMRLGHLGHLVQVPRGQAAEAAALDPANWTVFSENKAREAAAASRALGRDQALLARVVAAGDTFYRSQEGGFVIDEGRDINEIAMLFDALDGAHFAGITTFPALLFDAAARTVQPTPNLETLHRTVEALAKAGREGIRVNAPGTTSSVMLEALANAGATQVEPGHGLTGTTPLHATRDLPEVPAVAYLSEVSHLHRGEAWAFGGGLYVDPVFPPYQARALVSGSPTVSADALYDVEIPDPATIDYYAPIGGFPEGAIREGDTVLFGFRIQAFVTRAYVAGIRGIATGRPEVAGIHAADGSAADLPG
ncbi:alanine racemase [Catenulispora pinisilvae]|uniref:alanine racemase n=1 Tax=Catenulispora pinisilvae TaxID=2705253 RepID=UPI0018915B61|nr:alanine racemase [Catenulispora pinisilvae]